MTSSIVSNPTVANSNTQGERLSSHVQASTLAAENVVVALNAGKEITKHALEWALSNVVQAGDQITLVALLQGNNGRRLWSLPKLTGDCANGSSKVGKNEEEVTDSCSHMMQHLHKLCDAKQVKVSVRVVPGAGKGAIATEAQRVRATWVVLDSHLKKEESRCCMQQLQCNLVLVKRSDVKILRLNLRASAAYDAEQGPLREQARTPEVSKEGPLPREPLSNHVPSSHNKLMYSIFEEVASSSSAGGRTPFTATDKGTSSASSSEPSTSPLMSAEPLKVCASSRRDSEARIVETDSASDYGLAGVLSDDADESSSDELLHDVIMMRRARYCRTANASPEHRFKPSSFVKYFRPADLMPQPWLDCSLLTSVKRENDSVDPWMATTKLRPSSANATPRVHSKHHERASTPTSPRSSSKRFAGSSRLSLSMREGGSGLCQVSPSVVGSKATGLSYQRHNLHLKAVDPKNNGNTRCFESGNSTWVKQMLLTQGLMDKFSIWDQEAGHESGRRHDVVVPNHGDFERTSSVRRAMSLSRHVPPGPPPLCSICQHKAPVFGKPPRRFSYAELEMATGCFSQANFLAEGGFGSVHRGVLPDGQAVAVKQHKLASSQGDIEFCSEVEVLSCAQHRNVVMLIGYCIEDKRRLLVYEFICNGSLDSHLYGRDKGCLEWPSRQKIAVGAARGLRYLHEECRVGCIVHRDMRPNNILLTHDYEPMVGDFGLARWQPDGDLGVQTRVIGTFGYLAPEYAQSGQVTEKTDVYSFGVVLLELVTGRKAVDLNRPKGQQCLTEWARPLLDDHGTQDLMDPLLDGRFSNYEAYCMLHAASLCIRKDPIHRPRMSQVLRILEGDIVIDKSGSSTPSYGGKLAYNTRMYSHSKRMLNDYIVSRVATARSPQCSHNVSKSGMAHDFQVGELAASIRDSPSFRMGSKLSHDTMRNAYKIHHGNSRKPSYEEM